MKQFFKTMIIAASLALMVPTFPCYAETSVQEIIEKIKNLIQQECSLYMDRDSIRSN